MENSKKKLSISKSINLSLGCSIIPILLTKLEAITLFDYLSKYINIHDKYKTIIEQIENNIKNNKLNMASLTIEVHKIHKVHKVHKVHNINNESSHTKKKTHSHKKIHSHTKTNYQLQNVVIHQLFLIAINNNPNHSRTSNSSYNKTYIDELLELSRVSGNAIFNTLKTNQINTVNIVDTIDDIVLDNSKSNSNSKSKHTSNNISNNTELNSLTNYVSGSTQFIEALIEGLLLSSYSFLKYKTSKSLTKNKDKYKLLSINLVYPRYSKTIHKNDLYNRIQHLHNQIKSVFLSRDLVNEPANTAKADTFIDIIKSFIKENNVPVTLEVLDKKELEKLGMGLILGVGSGSNTNNEPRVVIMKYGGKGSKDDKDGKDSKGGKGSKGSKEPEYVLLGKGITFDTGGLDIKDSHNMVEMKTDLSGAALVMSFLLGYAMNKGNKCIYTICPFAENSVGPNSTKPSDILTAYNGRTVEVANTDAEGRLVLADCLAYTVDKYPKATIIDFATLTGAQVSLSGKMFSNILSTNSKVEVANIIKSGNRMNELIVELPLMEKYLKNLESYVADIKNMSTYSSAGIIMSALFLRQFVKKNTKWMHIDIAGPSYKVNDIIKYASPEASGVGVRLLFDYFD